MSVPLNVYFLYKISNACNALEFLLIKAVKPAWNNSVEIEGEEAEKILEKKRDEVLVKFISQNSWTGSEFMGQFEGEPEGDVFYEDHGGFYIDFWMAKSDFGFPWITISQAQCEEKFWRTVEEDIFLFNTKPLRPAEEIRAIFITELDY